MSLLSCVYQMWSDAQATDSLSTNQTTWVLSKIRSWWRSVVFKFLDWWYEQKRFYTCFFIGLTEFHAPYVYLVQLSETSQAGVRTCHVVGFTRGRYREHSTTRIEPDKTARWPRMSEWAPATGRPQRYPHVLAVRLWQMGLSATAEPGAQICPHVSSCFITMWSHSTDKAKSLTLISLYHQTFNQLKRLTA